MIIPATKDLNHNFRAMPNALEVIAALVSLAPETHAMKVVMPDFLTMRSFTSYVRRHYRGQYRFKDIQAQPEGWSCKVTKRRERAVKEKYGLKKRRLFLAVIDSFVRHNLVHYVSTCPSSFCSACGNRSPEAMKTHSPEATEQNIIAGKAQLQNLENVGNARHQKTQATQLDKAVGAVDLHKPTETQVHGVYSAAEAMDLAIFPEVSNLSENS